MGTLPPTRKTTKRKVKNERGFSNPYYQTKKHTQESKHYRTKNPICVECSKFSKNGKGLNMDHIIRIERGGHPSSELNKQTLCPSCHRTKTNKENQGYTIAFTGEHGKRIPIRPFKWIKYE